MEHEVREIVGLGVLGRKHIMVVLIGYIKDLDLILRPKEKATGGF